MKIYLAARYSRREELVGYRAALHNQGHLVTARWLNGSHQVPDEGLEDAADPELRCKFAKEDWEDLLDADCMIAFTELPRSGHSRGGRHVEFGIALATRMRTIAVGHRENVFYCLPAVEFYPRFSDVLDALK